MKLDVSSYIAELLYENDCVVLPDFGGFVASYKDSTIEFGDGTVNPPSKSISFNKSLTLNDGLLINHIVKKEGLSYEETKKKVEKFAKKCNRALAENETVVFPNVGKVSYDIEQNLKFEADSKNYLSDAYGLPTLKEERETTPTVVEDKPQTLHERLAAQQNQENPAPEVKQPIATEPKVEEKIVVNEPKIEEKPAVVKTAATTTTATRASSQPVRTSTKKEGGSWLLGWFPILAALALLGILSWGSYKSIVNKGAGTTEDNTELATGESDEVTGTSNEGEYNTEGAVEDDELEDEINEAVADEIKEEEGELDDMTATETKVQVKRIRETMEDVGGGRVKAPTSTASAGSKEYTVVIGAFSSRSNAEARQRSLEADGLTTEIGSLGRLHRVGVNIVCEPSEIQSRLRQIQEKYNKKAWLLKR